MIKKKAVKKKPAKKAPVKKRGRPKKKQEPEAAPVLTGKRAYVRAIKVIVELNEKIVAGEYFEDDPLWDELAELRKQLEGDDNEVIGRLITSLFVREKEIEIDEASPPTHAMWK
jgi:hypothetical protein